MSSRVFLFLHIFPRVLDPPFTLHLELSLCSCTDRNLASRPLTTKISSQRPAILPSKSLNGQRPPLSSSGYNRKS
ncbi:hypothetical protein Taro_008307 [Colocasia esculenta]|uniref:Uncharacterized protein n=1 Tax=Colocasia esculenta TaxID=4460 RepID=A0A843U0Q2_COLES|nr:hypothetical protein [Colocasia esculenta]